MIDILIPTYNRADELRKNLLLLNELIEHEALEGKFRIFISDNHSTDHSLEMIQSLKKVISIECMLFAQEKNIGLEKNSVFLLSKAEADFVMYLGDDDYLPAGYLSYVIQLAQADSSLSAVIPGISELHADGELVCCRRASFATKRYTPGFKTVLALSQWGHQLSGVVLLRSQLLETYTKVPRLRNIYPFIYFLAYNNLRGNTYFAPKYSVAVSVSNSKDWSYDASGLLTEILRNYRILYPEDYLKRAICSLTFMAQQSWRMRVSKNTKDTWRAFSHLMMSGDVDLLIKLALPLFYVYLYSRKVLIWLQRASLSKLQRGIGSNV